MLRKSMAICISMAFGVSLAVAANIPQSQAKLTAAEVVDRNVSARGGLEAWRRVHTMSWEGMMGVGGNQRTALPASLTGGKHGQQALSALPSRRAEEVQLPFVMELKRPGKTRIELQFGGQTAIQVFDGSNGWKLRPYLNRRVVEPYSPDEQKLASMQQDLDGPLVDYAAKGTRIELDGMEKVEDRDTYKLKLTMKSGQTLHVWIDAQTFLEAKMEGQPRRLDGVSHPVEIYFSDYRQVSGLQIPYVLETKVLEAKERVAGIRDVPAQPEKMILSKVLVNPALEESLFSKPIVSTVTSNAK
jgi:hypothetical protein